MEENHQAAPSVFGYLSCRKSSLCVSLNSHPRTNSSFAVSRLMNGTTPINHGSVTSACVQTQAPTSSPCQFYRQTSAVVRLRSSEICKYLYKTAHPSHPHNPERQITWMVPQKDQLLQTAKPLFHWNEMMLSLRQLISFFFFFFLRGEIIKGIRDSCCSMSGWQKGSCREQRASVRYSTHNGITIHKLGIFDTL